MIKKMAQKETPLLQVLLKVQDQNPYHYIGEDAVLTIAKELNLSKARVYSTASFYSEISLAPRGKNIIRVCSNAPCENAGKKEILDSLKSILKIDVGETTYDRVFTLETVNCLGACYMSPAIKINDTVYGNLESEMLPSILSLYKESELDESTK
jgi:NADH:ubiquinone oxidoreductase subunit E